MGGVLQNLKNMTVGSNKPHDGGDECSLPLVFLLNVNIVVPPLNIIDNLVNRVDSFIPLMSSGMRGRG